jgi:hypothetical protein
VLWLAGASYMCATFANNAAVTATLLLTQVKYVKEGFGFDPEKFFFVDEDVLATYRYTSIRIHCTYCITSAYQLLCTTWSANALSAHCHCYCIVTRSNGLPMPTAACTCYYYCSLTFTTCHTHTPMSPLHYYYHSYLSHTLIFNDTINTIAYNNN